MTQHHDTTAENRADDAIVDIHTTAGDIRVRLYGDTPRHRDNFIRLASEGFPLRGRWNEEFFHNSNPIVLELGCGKGEYTVGLARANADVHYRGIDIKGARLWTGARQARDEALPNVAFIRTNIELLSRFFAPGEVSACLLYTSDAADD